MTPHWDQVRRWLSALREDIPHAPHLPLSPQGQSLALHNALDALSEPALQQVASMTGHAFPSAGLIAARTVSTAMLEWCAVLLGRGTRVELKSATDADGLAAWFVRHAQTYGLSLHHTSSRQTALQHPLLLVMGSDETIETVTREASPDTRVLGFGHKFSAAYWDARDLDLSHAARIARDLAAHDTRGCMSPSVVFTNGDPTRGLELLAEALSEAEDMWPRGTLFPEEAASYRTRRAIAAILGTLVEGSNWSAYHIPLAHALPATTPRSLQLVYSTPQGAIQWLQARQGHLSTLGLSDSAEAADWRAAGAHRQCALGHMQKPPLVRNHDGVDALTLTLQ